MWNASQDANGRSTLLWVSSFDWKTPIPIKVNPITGRVLIEFVGSAIGVQPAGTPFTVWQLATYLTTDGYQIGALWGSGYIKLTAGVPSVLSAIVASDITQSASYRFVTDTEKTTWNAKQNALGYTAENTANKWVANGYAGLDATGKVPSAQLPSFVDDVLEFANLAGFPWTGETGKMYIALDTNKVYRWSGSVYVEISGSPWSTDAVTEGVSNLYFTTARVLGTLLAGLSTATNAVITASDSVLSAMGKLQKQISDNLATFNARTISAWTWLAGGGDLSANRTLSLGTRGANTIMGNNTGSASTPLDLTASQVLDMVWSTRGSILYRGASGWAILPPWSSGQSLTSQGAGADPIFASAWWGGLGNITATTYSQWRLTAFTADWVSYTVAYSGVRIKSVSNGTNTWTPTYWNARILTMSKT